MPKPKTSNEEEPAVTAAGSAPETGDAGHASDIAERPLPPKRELSRSDLETLRDRLRRKFH